jgi:hypothetical protein
MKLLAILLAVLLAISIYFNIRCDRGENTPGEVQWSADSLDMNNVKLMDLKLCIQGQNGDSCISSFDGMKGGTIELEKILPMLADTNINCLSFAYVYTPSADGTNNGKFNLVFHGNRYERGDGGMTIRYLPGPTYASDWMCPTDCPY